MTWAIGILQQSLKDSSHTDILSESEGERSERLEESYELGNLGPGGTGIYIFHR